MKDGIQTMDWALSRGVPGVMAVVIVALAITVVLLYRENRRLNEERLTDLRLHSDTLQKIMDRVHATIDKFEGYVEAIDRKRGR